MVGENDIAKVYDNLEKIKYLTDYQISLTEYLCSLDANESNYNLDSERILNEIKDVSKFLKKFQNNENKVA